MWRQGDIFIQAIRTLPREAAERPLPHTVLAHGELTGHSHRVARARPARAAPPVGRRQRRQVSSRHAPPCHAPPASRQASRAATSRSRQPAARIRIPPP
ncbi:hypothetical protein DK419_15790 [Methylobacterium terrae]|uniref:Uncharacterized protein n=1 Tax=Methylobacterium terrae TaxID=2202827 RepID=A0A2U8WQ67_9HYPH|nr:hypothetical protein DK419_15790 [Methylobacterium terrae]